MSQTETRIIQGSIDSEWEIHSPIEVEIEHCDVNGFIVFDSVFHVSGTGETREEAVEDYKASLSEYYEIVVAELQNRPTIALKQHLETYLRKKKP